MKIENLTKRYGEVKALDALDIQLRTDEITAVLGESGAGKTTLLNAIAGLISYEGKIDGVSGAKPVRRERCSYLLQDSALLPNLTAEQNLKFVLPETEWKKIPAMLERVGLGGKASARPRALSGGEKQRVAIARAFLYPHDLLLMDEPFASLDLALKKSLIALVRELREERGGGVVFVTHDVHEAVMLSHRALVLKKGALVCDLPIAPENTRDFYSTPAEESTLVRALTE